MGWGDCGTDSKGRPIGYVHEATCDFPCCEAKIDRGLAYACGGMHGENEGCEGYFCPAHLGHVHAPDTGTPLTEKPVCPSCQDIILADTIAYGREVFD